MLYRLAPNSAISNKENSMLKLRTLQFTLLATTLAMIINLALSAVTFAQDKRWRGRVHDKKAEKFINGHDARDGRWDGRGPRFRFRDRRDRDERFIFRNRRDRDERFIFRNRRDRGEWRDRWRDGDWHRRENLRRRRF
jgi:hypothetical protein